MLRTASGVAAWGRRDTVECTNGFGRMEGNGFCCDEVNLSDPDVNFAGPAADTRGAGETLTEPDVNDAGRAVDAPGLCFVRG